MSDTHLARSDQDTFELGRGLAQTLGSNAVVWLSGPLGSGKTVFAKGLFSAYGVEPESVTSPSFTLVNRYRLDPLLHHVDLYRLDQAAILADLGLDEILEEPGVVAVEWGERLEGLFDPPDVWVRIEIVEDEVRQVVVEKGQGIRD